MRACEIARLLATDAESVAQRLYPNGHKKAGEWVVGDTDGSDGESLKIRVEGSKAGVWCDFATGQKGDLIGLWMAATSSSLHDACADAMRMLGIVDTHPQEPAARHFSTPSREGVAQITPTLVQWLVEVRKIPQASIAAYRVAVKNGALMFPFLVGGELVAAKYRAAPAKKFWTDADCRPVLFGWQAVPKDARTVTLCEGEIDALALHAYGYPALSVPFGGGDGKKQQWIEHEFDRLAPFDRIYLCLDQDDVGRIATNAIAERLGRERCFVVRLPHKDADDCRMAGVEKASVDVCFQRAQTMDPERLRSAESFVAEVEAEFDKVEGGEPGIRLPWEISGPTFMLRPGETSLWYGVNGHGKSALVQQVMLDAIKNNFRCCAANLEFRPERWLMRVVRQGAADPMPSGQRIRHTLQAMAGWLWMYVASGSVTLDSVLDVFRYAVKRYGIDLFLIDNFAKLSIAEDDYQQHKVFMDRVSDFSRDMNVHVMVVAHTRKTERGEDSPPQKGDVKGSGALTDLADTVMAVWRNKPKERKLRENGGDLDTAAQPDAVVVCHKQRNGESEPYIRLWYDGATMQFLDRQGASAEPIIGIRAA